MERRSAVALAAGAVVGFALWLAAPAVLGRAAWDGGVFYLAALFVGGAATGWLDRTHVWPAPAGLYAGEALALLLDRVRAAPDAAAPHVLLQLLFLVGLSLCGLAGAVAVAAFRMWTAHESAAWSDRHEAERR